MYMDNRGRKRTEMLDEPLSDKRACSSSEFRLDSRNSVSETTDCNMDSSSSSVSGEVDRDSAYGSCDSDEIDDTDRRIRAFEDFHSRVSRLSQLSGEYNRILMNLKEDSELCDQLFALNELCHRLSLCTEDSILNMPVDSLVSTLVNLCKNEKNQEIVILATRALAYLADVYPRASVVLVRHDAVPVLCETLSVIHYMEVAEQCLQVLEKISNDHSVVCLKSGVIKAALTYLDFFPIETQRLALSTIANICKNLPADSASFFMEAIPILSNLLQYEDIKVVEHAVLCFIRIVDSQSCSSEVVNELCQSGVIGQCLHLIGLCSQKQLSQATSAGLIGMLSKIASRSHVAIRELFQLNISDIMREILRNSGLILGSSHTNITGRSVYYNQVYEVLKLLNVLLPPLKRDDKVISTVGTEMLMIDQPELVLKFGVNVLPVLIEVASSGVNLNICYGCLSIITKLFHFYTDNMLVDLVRDLNVSSFLAGVFAWKDIHVLNSAMIIVEIAMQKLPHIMLQCFLKEGVIYAIDSFLASEKCSEDSSLNYTITSNTNLECLCYTFEMSHPLSSESKPCNLGKDNLHTLARHIKDTYFLVGPENTPIESSEILLKLKAFSVELNDNLLKDVKDDARSQHSRYLSLVLDQIFEQLNGKEPLSTFEFIESGIVRSLVNFLFNGKYPTEELKRQVFPVQVDILLERLETFSRVLLKDSKLALLVKKLQKTLSYLDHFPVIINNFPKSRNVYAHIPYGHYTTNPCIKVQFVRDEGETYLRDYSSHTLKIEAFSSFKSIEGFLWPKVCPDKNDGYVMMDVTQSSTWTSKGSTTGEQNVFLRREEEKSTSDDIHCKTRDRDINLLEESKENLLYSHAKEGSSTCNGADQLNRDYHKKSSSNIDQSVNESDKPERPETSICTEDSVNVFGSYFKSGVKKGTQCEKCSSSKIEGGASKLLFFMEGKKIDKSMSIYQAILQKLHEEHNLNTGTMFWNEVYKITYKRDEVLDPTILQDCFHMSVRALESNKVEKVWNSVPFFLAMPMFELPIDLNQPRSTRDVLILLKLLEDVNKFMFKLMYYERIKAFAEGKMVNLDDMKMISPAIQENEFLNTRLTEKLEQQLQDSLATSIGSIPWWWNQLLSTCPFLFSFEARWKYFRLVLSNTEFYKSYPIQERCAVFPRKKFQVFRSHILDSATQMMDLHAYRRTVLEVEYHEEVGTGLGPTMEFYTLVSQEFQKIGLRMWRGDYYPSTNFVKGKSLQNEEIGNLAFPLGLFPRPWSNLLSPEKESEFSKVIKKFVLLGQMVAKAIQDGRMLDIPFSRAFYKLMLGQELDIYDVPSFDPELGKILLEFEALIQRKKLLDTVSVDSYSSTSDLRYRDNTIEDLCLDFGLPGYSDYMLTTDPNKTVNAFNLEEYVSLILDATIGGGIVRQVEAFKSGFNQVFPLKHLQIFTENELECLLCGEPDVWTSSELSDQIKFDHGYTSSSPPAVNLLKIIEEFQHDQRRAFLQFVTGSPRLPRGGLASLDPKLTIVRKHCSGGDDADLPSVMTCANYLKLPPYSSKEKMREKLLYAITEGQGSFHLS